MQRRGVGRRESACAKLRAIVGVSLFLSLFPIFCLRKWTVCCVATAPCISRKPPGGGGYGGWLTRRCECEAGGESRLRLGSSMRSSWHGGAPQRKGSSVSIDSMGVGLVGNQEKTPPPLAPNSAAPIYGTCFGYLHKLSSGRGLSSKQWQKRW